MWPEWLVFCDCGFQPVCSLMEKDKRLMEASWWERLTKGRLGLVLMGGAILSKSLIQFSVDGWGYISSMLFIGVSASFSWLLVHTRFCLWSPESVFPGLCKFCQLYGRVNGDLLQVALCHTQICWDPEPLCLWKSTADPYLHRRYSNTVLSQFLWGLWVLVCPRFVWALEHLCWVWCWILNIIFPLLPSCWGFSFALGWGLSPQRCSCVMPPLLQGWKQWQTLFFGAPKSL